MLAYPKTSTPDDPLKFESWKVLQTVLSHLIRTKKIIMYRNET